MNIRSDSTGIAGNGMVCFSHVVGFTTMSSCIRPRLCENALEQV